MQLSCVHLDLLLACLSAFLSVFLLVCFATTFREQFLDLKAGVFHSLQSMLVYIVVGRLHNHIGNKHLAYYHSCTVRVPEPLVRVPVPFVPVLVPVRGTAGTAGRRGG